MKTWQSLKSDLLSNPELKAEYDVLAPQFELAAQLIEARVKSGLTQAQLAAKVGTGQSAIARLESGGYNPTIRLLERVAAATGSKLVVRLQS